MSETHPDVIRAIEVPDVIKTILGRPGIYIASETNPERGIAFIEVDTDGCIHQLKPSTGERDGELVIDGWSPRVRVFGPEVKT